MSEGRRSRPRDRAGRSPLSDRRPDVRELSRNRADLTSRPPGWRRLPGCKNESDPGLAGGVRTHCVGNRTFDSFSDAGFSSADRVFWGIGYRVLASLIDMDARGRDLFPSQIKSNFSGRNALSDMRRYPESCGRGGRASRADSGWRANEFRRNRFRNPDGFADFGFFADSGRPCS